MLERCWGKHEGIGVDVHVHRTSQICGVGVLQQRTRKETRMALQSWLPRDKWHDGSIKLLVGLGQTACLPVGRKLMVNAILQERGYVKARLRVW